MQETHHLGPSRGHDAAPDRLADRSRAKPKFASEAPAPDLFDDLNGICHNADYNPNSMDLVKPIRLGLPPSASAPQYAAKGGGWPMDPDDNKAVADRLRFLMSALGYDRQDLFAKDMGVNPKALSNWLKGEKDSQRLSLDGAKAIRRTFGVPMDWLYFGGMVDALPHKVAVAWRSRPSVSQSKASTESASDF